MNILITGGTGSIGSAVTSAFGNDHEKRIAVYSRNESSQFELAVDLAKDITAYRNIKWFIGDVRDFDKLNSVVRTFQPHCIIHCAAMKHVVYCEDHPDEAVKTNIIGTQNVLDACMRHYVSLVLMSTDKAVNPISIMGNTKLIAERLILNAVRRKVPESSIDNSRFIIVRCGNVLGSRGSILPLVEKCKKRNVPVPITDFDMKRYFIEVHDVVDLIDYAVSEKHHDGEIIIPKMSERKVIDVIREIVGEDYPISIVGKGSGEKLREELMTAEEAKRSYEQSGYIHIPIGG